MFLFLNIVLFNFRVYTYTHCVAITEGILLIAELNYMGSLNYIQEIKVCYNKL